MAKRARLKREKGGLAPSTGGWFVVNASASRWWRSARFGWVCPFEGKRSFPHLGIRLHLLLPGRSNCMYHRESEQEDFLILEGRCTLLVEEKKVPLKKWDFVHCPPGTNHVFVGAGGKPCVVLMVGARRPGARLTYPASRLARRHDASVARETHAPRVAYRGFPRWVPVRAPWPPRAGRRG